MQNLSFSFRGKKNCIVKGYRDILKIDISASQPMIEVVLEM